MISQNDKERVLDATNIVDVIGESVSLRAKGREFVCLCPFHDDHKPSMSVVPHKQMYYCFSCGAGGDALTFMMEYHKLGFREAMESLAERAGVGLTPETRGDAQRAQEGRGQRERLLSANEAAARYYQTLLRHSEHGKAGREVLERRGVSAEMAEAFGIGVAADRWDGLVMTAQQKKWEMGALRQAGLIKERSSSPGDYDVFRHRLMFPIMDQMGRVIAFGGRKMRDEDEPKYMNTPENEVFDKSSTLYGIHAAAQAIRTSGVAIVTEGYTDVIACHQAGVKNVVATLGTALTRKHARVLRRLCETVVLLFDGDEAGQRAADRATEVFFAEPIDVRIAIMGQGSASKDPDELLKEDGGREAFEAMIEHAIDAIDFRASRLAELVRGAGISGTARAIEEELERLVGMGLMDVAPVRKQLTLKRLATASGVELSAIRESLEQVSAKRRRHRDELGPERVPAGDQVAATMGVAEHVLGCVLCDGSLWASLTKAERDSVLGRAYADVSLGALVECMKRVDTQDGSLELARVVRESEDTRVHRAAAGLCARIETLTGHDAQRLHQHWRDRVTALRREMADSTQHAGERAQEVPVQSSDDAWRDAVSRLRDRAKQERSNPLAMPLPGDGQGG